MDKKREDIIRRIRAMQELTNPESNAFSGEISNASAMIQTLMDKYSISEIDLAMADNQKIEDAFKAERSDAVLFNVVKWHWSLARLVAKVTHTRHYQKPIYSNSGFMKSGRNWRRDKKKGPRRYANTMAFYGSPDNVTVACEMFLEWFTRIEVISIQAVDEYLKAKKQYIKIHGSAQFSEFAVDGRTFRRSWIDGCLSAMFSKVREQEKERDEGTSAALVLYKDKVDDAYKEFSKGFRKSSGHGYTTFSGAGYAAGESVGSSLQMTPTKKLSTGQKLLKG